MVTDVKPLQPLKAPFPIDVTPLPIANDVNPLQPPKAFFPIDVTLSPRIISFIEVKFWNQLGTDLHNKVTDVNALQPLKADSPIDVTLSPIVTDVNPLQP